MNLTLKEQKLFDSIQRGMDNPGSGWLHELNPFSSDKECAGVLSSLIKKKLVTSYQDEDFPGCYWIEMV